MTSKPETTGKTLEQMEPIMQARLAASRSLTQQAADALGEIVAERNRYRAALVRLRDCDWTITPLDRMDAVRDIARAALNGEDTRPHD